MKVKQLISKLKKLPQNLSVEVALHDNAAWESAGTVSGVQHFEKEDFIDDIHEYTSEEDKRMFEDMKDECVIIRC